MSYFVTFDDGPAAACDSLSLLRAPTYMRVVRGIDGKWDALDQLDDDPGMGEEIFIYRRVPGSYGHICQRHPRECTTMIRYRHTDEIDPEGMEDRETWRAAVDALPPTERNPNG